MSLAGQSPARQFKIKLSTSYPHWPFADTHYGTREMTVRDPDGRVWSLQAPVAT